MDLIFAVVGAILDASKVDAVPTWGWLLAGAAGLAIAPFLAFHRMRLQRDAAGGTEDVFMNVRPEWMDDVGRPKVYLHDDSRLHSVHAPVRVEVRNTGAVPKRVSDLYMEIVRRGHFRSRRPLATVDPTFIDYPDERDPARRVEWELPPNSPAIAHHVQFGSPPRPAPVMPSRKGTKYNLIVVAELGSPGRAIRKILDESAFEARE